MAINYREEVDSGYDRKRLVEACEVALLRENIPLDIITKGKAFNYRHLEMIRNLGYGYKSKEEQVLNHYGGYSKELDEQIVSDNYSGVSHPVGGELYPMEKDEELEKFKQRDSYLLDIDKLKQKELKRLDKERTKLLNSITRYKIKYPIIDKIIEVVEEIDEKQNNGESFDAVSLFEKKELKIKDLEKYNLIYKNYIELLNSFDSITLKYENAKNGKFDSEEIKNLIEKKNSLETEIIQRNTKLVNGFIRQKCADLLVDTDDLFQICYIAMWDAIKDFDYKKGAKFSGLAYYKMSNAVRDNFKILTGYNKDVYYTRKKIEILLEKCSQLLRRKLSLNDLVSYGFLGMSEVEICKYMNLAVVDSLSDLIPIGKESYDEYDIDSQYAMYFGDDEIDDYENGVVDEIVINCDIELFKGVLKKSLNDVLNTLTEREKLVLKLRFGLEDGRARSLEEVCKVFNCTRERIRQIEAKALRKLRHPSRREKLEGFLDEYDKYEEVNTFKR